MARLARPAFERHTGTGSHGGKYRRRIAREGGGPAKVRAESRQYSLSEAVRVRAYRRSHPGGPPRPRDVRVHGYWRGRFMARHARDDSQRQWVRYLADYYGVSIDDARRMERETRA